MKITEALSEATAKLQKHRGRNDIRLDELVKISNDLINLVVPLQPSDRVAANLNERTLRYYISEGLIDRPTGKEGTASLYSYKHLLQALIVKALQGAYLPIKRIRQILAGKSDPELEGILACQAEIPADRDGVGQGDAMAVEIQEMDMQTARRKARNYLNILEDSLPPKISESVIAVMEPPAEPFIKGSDAKFCLRRPLFSELPASDPWERFVLEDGVELHVRADRVKQLCGSQIKRILERLLNLLKNRQ